MANEQKMQVGKVVQVIGAVVDIAFDDDKELPAIYNAIHIRMINTAFLLMLSVKPCSTWATASFVPLQ